MTARTINSDMMNAYRIKVTIQLQMNVVWIHLSIHLLKPVRPPPPH
jgi:hypothetical protein